jgi:hypothetical protein
MVVSVNFVIGEIADQSQPASFYQSRYISILSRFWIAHKFRGIKDQVK